jgi:hypothetical protein
MLADIGIPMIFVQWPLMIGALIPVIIVESLVIRRWIPLSYRDAFSGVFLRFRSAGEQNLSAGVAGY